MIKLNKSYTINYGQGSIVFTEIDKGTVSASYTIKGNKNEGKIDGKLDGNVLKGTFHVDVSAGLIEFTFSEDGFDAKWKQGIEPGPMRGKWEGQFRINKDFTEKIKEYNMLELAKKGVFSFSQNLNEVLEKAAQFDEATQFDFMSNYFTQLENFVSNNLEYVYFERIAIKVTQNFYNKNKISYFPEDNEAHKEKYCFEINSLRNTGLISLVINKEQLDISKINSNENQFNNFINYISSYFIYSIESIVAEDEAEELAEFIFSISSNTFREILDDENCIVDQIIDVLRAYGFNINDYEGNCEIYPNYYLKNSVNSGYDYVKFCKDIISELFCE